MANIDDIIIFNKIYETGSYTKAAVHLNIPKATISRRVRLLEEKLGVNLINRDTRKISLTEAGHHLYGKTNSLLYKIQEAQESVSELQNEISGDLKITIPVEIGIRFINDIICRFLEKHTLIRLEINMTNEVVDIIKDGYDLAIRGGSLKDSNLISKKIIESKFYVCCSPEYLEKNSQPKHPADLESHTIFSCTYPKSNSLKLSKGREEYAFSECGQLSANSLDLALKCALNGLGIAIIPASICSTYIKNEELITILNDWSMPDVGLYALYPNRNKPKKLTAFIDFLSMELEKEQKNFF